MTLNIEVLPRIPAQVYGQDGITVTKSNGALTIGFDYATSGFGAELQQAVDAASASASSIEGDAAAAAASASEASASATAAAASAEDAAAAVENVQTAADPQQYAEGDDLSEDCKATFDRMIAAGLTYWKGRPGAVYKHVGQFTVPTSGLDFDLNGATLKVDVDGAYSGIATENYQASTAFGAYAINVPADGDYPLKTVTTVDAISGDFQVGRDVWFVSAGGSAGGVLPPSWRTIAAISGNDITFDKDITAIMYADSIKLWVVKSWVPFFRLYNGVMDCSLITGTDTVGAINVEGVEVVNINNVDFVGVNFNTAGVGPGNGVIRALRCGDVSAVNNRFKDATRYGSFIQSQYCRSATYIGNNGDGEGFGLNFDLTDNVVAIGNKIEGRFRTKALSGSSVRGIKVRGVHMATVLSNIVRDYDSGMKIEDTRGVTIQGNSIEYVRTGINNANQNTDADSVWSGHTIVGNLIKDCVQDGIAVSSGGALDITITGNTIRDVGLCGIRYNPVTGVCSNNSIYNWSLAATGNYPIYQSNTDFKGSVIGNRAYHDNPADGAKGFYINSLSCMFTGNISNTAKVYEKYGASAPDISTGLEIGQGVIMKYVTATSITDSDWLTVNFGVPFPGGFLGVIAISAGAASPAGFSYQSGTASSVQVKATTSVSSARLLVLGY